MLRLCLTAICLLGVGLGWLQSGTGATAQSAPIDALSGCTDEIEQYCSTVTRGNWPV